MRELYSYVNRSNNFNGKAINCSIILFTRNETQGVDGISKRQVIDI